MTTNLGCTRLSRALILARQSVCAARVTEREAMCEDADDPGACACDWNPDPEDCIGSTCSLEEIHEHRGWPYLVA